MLVWLAMREIESAIRLICELFSEMAPTSSTMLVICTISFSTRLAALRARSLACWVPRATSAIAWAFCSSAPDDCFSELSWMLEPSDTWLTADRLAGRHGDAADVLHDPAREPAHRDRLIEEDLEGAGHVADLVAAIGVRHGDFRAAGRQGVHRLGEALDRPGDGEHDDAHRQRDAGEDADGRQPDQQVEPFLVEGGDVVREVVREVVVRRAERGYFLVERGAVVAVGIVVAPVAQLDQIDLARDADQLGAETDELVDPRVRAVHRLLVLGPDQAGPLLIRLAITRRFWMISGEYFSDSLRSRDMSTPRKSMTTA